VVDFHAIAGSGDDRSIPTHYDGTNGHLTGSGGVFSGA